MRSVFINYRRSDSEGEAGRLFDDLTSRFGDASIFMDVAAIEPGRDFRKVIDQSVATCSVLLAVIGPEWLASKDAQGLRRLDDANDFVRIELSAALRRDTPVVPVLVRGTTMPQVDQLPEDLKELAYRNAVVLTHARWKSDIQVLTQALRAYLEMPSDAEPAANRPGKDQDMNKLSTRVPENQAIEAAEAVAGLALTMEPHTMERVSKELGAFIGPISEVIVKRSMKKCSSVEELYEMVAREIVAEADRAKFLRSCRSQSASPFSR